MTKTVRSLMFVIVIASFLLAACGGGGGDEDGAGGERLQPAGVGQGCAGPEVPADHDVHGGGGVALPV